MDADVKQVDIQPIPKESVVVERRVPANYPIHNSEEAFHIQVKEKNGEPLLVFVQQGKPGEDKAFANAIDKFKNNEDQSFSLDKISEREKAMKEEAMKYGTQSGLKWRANSINNLLEENGILFDRGFNFSSLVIDHYILPPVISRTERILKEAGKNSIRKTRVVYNVSEQAKIITSIPTWRNYLILPETKLSIPSEILKPRNDGEQYLFNLWVREGWDDGVKQADTMFTYKLNNLVRIYRGMLTYEFMYKKGMVSSPTLNRKNLGVVSNGKILRVGDEILSVEKQPNFTSTENWQAIVSDGKDRMNNKNHQE